MADELKRCPYCGGAPSGAGFWRHVITCHTCGARSAPFSNWDEAVEAWNSRALSPAQEHGDELYKALGYVLSQLRLAFMGFASTSIDANALQTLYDSIEEADDAGVT